jgi:hypothetical protein
VSPRQPIWYSLLIILGTSLILASVGFWYTREVQSRLECQARYNEVNNARTRALTEATAKERQAGRAEDKARANLITNPAILKPAADRTPAEAEHLRQLTLAWQATLVEEQRQQAAADAERQQYPVPPPPSELCG